MRNNRVISAISIALFGLFFYMRFEESLDPLSMTHHAYETLLIIACLFCALINIIQRPKVKIKESFSKSFYRYFLWLWISAMFAAIHHPLGSLNLVGLLLFPLLSYIIMYKVAYGGNDKLRSVVIAFCGCFALYISIRYLSSRTSHLDYITQLTQASGGAYFSVVLLPFILLINRKSIKYPLSVLVLIVSVLSAKRGGAIAVSLALASSVIIDFFLSSNTKEKFKYTSLIILVAVIGIYYGSHYMIDDISGLSERFEEGDYRQGSRNQIYAMVINMITSSNIFYIIFGHGWDSVLRDGTMGYSAHNDFLESFYDFGFIGFILYVGLHQNLLRKSVRLIKCRSSAAASFAASEIIFLTFGMISHIILYPPMSLALSMYWGFVNGEIDSPNNDSTNNKQIS